MPKKITRRLLDALKPKDGTERGTWIADAELAGFHVVAYSSGVRAFAARYRVAGSGRRRTVRLGTYPGVTAEDARKEARAIIGGAARGEDEAAKRDAARHEAEAKAKRITFGTWRADYVRDAAPRLKPRTLRDVARYLDLAGEEWDRRPLAEITTRDVETLRDRIAKRGTTQANRWRAHVGASFAHAVRLGYIDVNPAARVPSLRENEPRTRTLDAAEEKRLRAAVKADPDPFIRAAFMLLIDTGARSSEVCAAKWDDFDLDGGTWRIPAQKSGRSEALPLLPETVAVLNATPRLDRSPYLVPGRSPFAPRRDLRKAWDALRTAAKIGPDVHTHDLRRTFGLRVTRRVGIFAASKLLRHGSVAITTRVYAPLTAEDLRGFAERAAAPVLPFKGKKARKP